MNCATYPWMKLAHSATIPCVSQMLSSNGNSNSSPSSSGTAGGGSGGGGEHDSIDRPSSCFYQETKPNQGATGPDGQLNRSLSFDGRRKVWARVEAHWARVTLDRSVPSTGHSLVKYEPQGGTREQPFYQRIRSWLTSHPQTQTYQQSPVMTKVNLLDNIQQSQLKIDFAIHICLLSFNQFFFPPFPTDWKCTDVGSLQQQETVNRYLIPDCYSSDIRRPGCQEGNMGIVVYTYHVFFIICFYNFNSSSSGSIDACSDSAKVAFIDRRCTLANSLQDIFVGDLRVASRTRMSRPLYKSHANVSTL